MLRTQRCTGAIVPNLYEFCKERKKKAQMPINKYRGIRGGGKKRKKQQKRQAQKSIPIPSKERRLKEGWERCLLTRQEKKS